MHIISAAAQHGVCLEMVGICSLMFNSVRFVRCSCVAIGIYDTKLLCLIFSY